MRASLVLAALVALLIAAPQAQVSRSVTLDLVLPNTATSATVGLGDLVVRLDGRVYPVTAVRRSLALPTTPMGPWPPPYGRNDVAQGRTLAVLVDTPRLPAARLQAITAGVTTLTQGLAPADRVALIPINTDARPVDFTTSHARVVEAAAALPLSQELPRQDNRERDAAVEAMLDSAGRLATMLGATPGVKIMVVVTEPFRVNGRLREAMQLLGETVARNRVALYVASPSPETKPGDGAHTLAASTGGLVLAPGWKNLLEQETRRVEVQVAVDDRLSSGSTVRTIVAGTRKDLSPRFVPYTFIRPEGPDALESLSDMLRMGRVFTDLPLRLAAYPVLHTDRSSIRLLIVAETIEPESSLQWAEFALISPDGRFLSQWREERDALTQRPVISGALTDPGTYRLRWAASELTGRRGTVDVEVNAHLAEAGGFRLSALMLGRLETDTFIPVLQPHADDPSVEWYAEVYGEPQAGQLLTARVDVRAVPGGPIVATESGRVLTSPDPQRRAMTGRLATEGLAPGDYQLTATLSANGTDLGAVSQTLRKER